MLFKFKLLPDSESFWLIYETKVGYETKDNNFFPLPFYFF